MINNCNCENQKYFGKVNIEFENEIYGSFSFSFNSISNDNISNCSLPNNKAYNKALNNFLHKHKNYTNITKITTSINTVTKIKNCDYNTNARIGYYKTLCPSEMTDLYRSHCVLNGGLPLLPKKLKITTFDKLPAPSFGYTRKQNEIYILGGSVAFLGAFINGIVNETAVCQDNIINQYVICYDPINKSISCNKLYSNGNFEFIWQQNNLTISACIAIVVNKNHIYIDDYVNGYDYFVVLELSTGNEISRIKTKSTLPTIGSIFPGMNNDVYLLSNQIGDKKGYITRIFV